MFPMFSSGSEISQPSFSCPTYPWQTTPRSWLSRLAAGAALALLALPGAANGQSGYEVHPGGIELILPVRTTPDYTISVSTNGRQRVQLLVTRNSSTTEYTTTGHVSSRSIHADFGSLGRVNVRFRLTPIFSDPPHKGRCNGRATSYRAGTYGGTIEFAHTGDVPEVSASRGRVYFTHRFRQVCAREQTLLTPGPKSKLSRKVEVAFLAVRGHTEGRSILLEAVTLALKWHPGHSSGRLATVVYERDQGVRIAKTLSVPIDSHSFALSRLGATPETIDVELASPFQGHARYSISPGSPPHWEGDLSVTLSGIGKIPLTGSAFQTILCRQPLVTKVDDCTSRIRP